MCDNLKSASAGIHVQQRICRDAISIRVDGHVPSNAREAAIPHASHHIGAVDGSCEHAGILTDAIVESVRVEEHAIKEGGYECRNWFILAERVIVFCRGDVFDL